MEGIFEITNTKNKRKYYGYSEDCYQGIKQAFKMNEELRYDVENYGIKAFYHKVLLECNCKDEDDRRALLWKYINKGREFTKQGCYNTDDLNQEIELSYSLREPGLVNNECR